MVVVGLPGGTVELRGTYVCTCRLKAKVTLLKGDVFPKHSETEVWLWGGWPWKRPAQKVREIPLTISVIQKEFATTERARSIVKS